MATVEKLKMPMSDRDHEREQPGDLELRVRQVDVGLVEAALLVVAAHERADHADARELLAHDLVHPVDLDLHRLEERQRRAEASGR